MAKIIGIIIAALFFKQTVQCQQTSVKNKLHYTPVLSVGITEGAAGKTAAQLQLSNALSYNSWLAGIGCGIDYYNNKRSIPVFLLLQKELFKNKNTPFLYAATGYNFSWLRDEQKTKPFFSFDHKELNGLYYEIGAGYKLTFQKKYSLGLSAGYSLKQQGEKYFLFERTDQSEQFDYTFRRFSLKISCWF